MQWYYARSGQQCGPVDEQEIQRLIREGQLTSTDLVWHAGLGDQWVAAGTANPQWFVAEAMPAPVPQPVYEPECSNAELMRRGRESLRGRWGLGVGICFLYIVVVQASSMLPYAGVILVFLLAGPMMVGLANAFLGFAQQKPLGVGHLFSGFEPFGRNVIAYLLMQVFIFLWMLLLIIPGILAAYAYSMTPFILAEDPHIGAREAIRRSKAMMQGNRWKLFCLFLRFIGWVLLAVLTCGIGYLWLFPYMQASMAHFYLNVSRRAQDGVSG